MANPDLDQLRIEGRELLSDVRRALAALKAADEAAWVAFWAFAPEAFSGKSFKLPEALRDLAINLHKLQMVHSAAIEQALAEDLAAAIRNAQESAS